MRKLAFAILAICGCFVYSACSSHPVSGSCPVKDFNGACCITWSDCNTDSGNPGTETQLLENGCHALDPQREPLLCLENFNTTDLPNCVPLLVSGTGGGNASSQQEEGCYGTGDGWNGASDFTYNVFCCK